MGDAKTSQGSCAAEEGNCSDSADSLDMLRDFVDAMDNSPSEPVRALSGTAGELCAQKLLAHSRIAECGNLLLPTSVQTSMHVELLQQSSNLLSLRRDYILGWRGQLLASYNPSSVQMGCVLQQRWRHSTAYFPICKGLCLVLTLQ